MGSHGDPVIRFSAFKILKQRLFIAIDPPENIRQEITGLQQDLDRLKLPVIFELPEKFHVTLNFIGAVDKDFTGTLANRIREITMNFQAFNLRPYFLETLYQKHDQSLIYLGLAGDLANLKKIRLATGQMLADSGIPQKSKYLPHLTVARMKKADPVITKTALDKIIDFEFQPLSSFLVDHLTLYESLLSQKGSHYRQVGRFMLQ